MYSVVLMMALSGGAQTPEFCHGWGCGCYGGGWSSCGCYGGGWSGCGCYGGGWSGCGCYGGGYVSFGCGGCGGWSGCGSYGCGSYGGCGGYVSYGCGGCGHVSYGCGHVSYGCGGYGGHHGCCGGGGAVVAPAQGIQGGGNPLPAPTKTPPPPPPPPGKGKGVNNDDSARGRIEVNLPANASLSFDGHQTTQTTAQRMFHTPPLETGRDYYYTLRAEATVDGQNVVKTERVAVRAGQTTRVSLDFNNSGVAAR